MLDKYSEVSELHKLNLIILVRNYCSKETQLVGGWTNTVGVQISGQHFSAVCIKNYAKAKKELWKLLNQLAATRVIRITSKQIGKEKLWCV